LFLQYKRQQHEDRELLKELWRGRQDQYPSNREPTRLKTSQPNGLIRTRSDLNLTDPNWYLIVPSQRVKPRDCDEVPDEFKRAGIGLCFEGKMFTLKWINSIHFPI